MNGEETLAEIVVGHRTVLGINWPILHRITRHKMNGRVDWVVTDSLCNGVPSDATFYQRKKDAVKAFEKLKGVLS